MRYKVMTWNTQGFSDAKLDELARIGHEADFICVQEAGRLAELDLIAGTALNGWNVYGWPGADTDGYANNRVSLAIVTRYGADEVDFVPADARGLGYIKINQANLLVGTWHEKRGSGGLGGCLNALRTQGVVDGDTSCIIGGDFNDTRHASVRAGSRRRGGLRMHSVGYNFLYSMNATHRRGRNLDRIFATDNFSIIHHYCTSIRLSDHNPVFAELVNSRADLTAWEAFKEKFGAYSEERGTGIWV